MQVRDELRGIQNDEQRPMPDQTGIHDRVQTGPSAAQPTSFSYSRSHSSDQYNVTFSVSAPTQPSPDDVGRVVHRLTQNNDVTSIRIAGNKIITGSPDGTARIWDLNTGACLQTLHASQVAAPAQAEHDQLKAELEQMLQHKEITQEHLNEMLGIEPSAQPHTQSSVQDQANTPVIYPPSQPWAPARALTREQYETLLRQNLQRLQNLPSIGRLPSQPAVPAQAPTSEQLRTELEQMLQNKQITQDQFNDMLGIKPSEQPKVESMTPAVSTQPQAATSSTSASTEPDVCSICLSELGTSDEKMKCGHRFHAKCLLDWALKGNLTCPLCMANLKKQ